MIVSDTTLDNVESLFIVKSNVLIFFKVNCLTISIISLVSPDLLTIITISLLSNHTNIPM